MAGKLNTGLIAITLAGMTYLIAVQPDASLQHSSAVGRAHAPAEHSKAIVDAIKGLRRELAGLETRMNRRLDGIEKRLEATDRSVKLDNREFSRAAKKSAAADQAKTPDTIAKTMVKEVEDRLTAKIERLASRRMNRNREGQWKASMDDLAAELKLDDETKEMAYGVFNGAHDEIFALFKKARVDGTSILDDMVGDFREGAPDWEQRLRKRLTAEKVPGTDQTYMEALGALYERVSGDLADHMSPEQMTGLKDLNVALLEIKTGYDPIGDFIRTTLSQ